MSFSLVQTSAEIYVASGTSGNATLTGVAAGNLLVVVVDCLNNVSQAFTVSDDNGNTWTTAVQNVTASAANRSFIACVVSAAAGDTVVTVASDNTCEFIAKVQEWNSSVGGTWALDVVGSIDVASSTSHFCAAVGAIDTNGGAVVVSNSVVDTTSNQTFGSLTPGSGFTQISASTAQVMWQYQTFANSTANQRGAFTSGTARAAAGAIASFRFDETTSSGCWWPCCTSAGATTKVYVSGGGATAGANETDTHHAYTVSTNNWAAKTVLTAAKHEHEAAALSTLIYAWCGSDFFSGSDHLYSANDEYDTDANTWASRTAHPVAHTSGGGATCNSKIYSTGGQINTTFGTYGTGTHEYVFNSWASKTALPVAAAFHAVAVYDDWYHRFGGNNDQNYRYDQPGDSWASKTVCLSAVIFAGAHRLDSYLYLIGSAGDPARNDQYDPSGDSWATMAAITNSSHAHTTALAASAGYTMNGFGSAMQSYNQMYVVDTWTQKNTTPESKYAAAGATV